MNMRLEFDIDTASKMWNQGFSAGMIANALGVSRNVVIGKANRNRELFPNKAKTGIRGGHRVGIPRAEITEEERERRRNNQNAKRRSERAFTRQTKAESIEQRRANREVRATEHRQRGFTAAIDILRQPTAKPLYALRSCDCHWPVNDGGPYLYCASAVAEDSDYCAEHMERSLPEPANRRVSA